MALIVGPESALREEALQALRVAAFGKGQDGGLNWLVLHGPLQPNESEAVTAAVVLDEVCTRPMFAADDEPKVVVVRSAELLLAEHYHIFEDALDKIPDTASLVFEASAYGKLKTTNFLKALAARNAVLDCQVGDRPEETALLEREVETRAQARGLQLAHGALLALVNRSAKNLAVLDEELDKLALQFGAKPGVSGKGLVPISEESVAEYCALTSTFSAFNFVDALLQRDTRHTLEVLDALFERGLADSRKPGKLITQDDAIAMVVLGALTYRLFQLQDLRAALDAGKSENTAFVEAKVFGRGQEAARRLLRRHTGASLRQAVEALFVCYLDLRRGGAQPREVLEQLVFKLRAPAVAAR